MKFFEDERLLLVDASGKTEQLPGLVKIQGRQVMMRPEADGKRSKAASRRDSDQFRLAQNQERRQPAGAARLIAQNLDLVPDFRYAALGVIDDQYPAPPLRPLVPQCGFKTKPCRAHAVGLSQAEIVSGQCQKVERIERPGEGHVRRPPTGRQPGGESSAKPGLAGTRLTRDQERPPRVREDGCPEPREHPAAAVDGDLRFSAFPEFRFLPAALVPLHSFSAPFSLPLSHPPWNARTATRIGRAICDVYFRLHDGSYRSRNRDTRIPGRCHFPLRSVECRYGLERGSAARSPLCQLIARDGSCSRFSCFGKIMVGRREAKCWGPLEVRERTVARESSPIASARFGGGCGSRAQYHQ